MPHFVQDHQPVPVGQAILLTNAQMDELKTFIADRIESLRDVQQPVIGEEHFNRLFAMLQPGFELSTAMLAEYRAAHQGPQSQPGQPVVANAAAMREEQLSRDRAVAEENEAHPLVNDGALTDADEKARGEGLGEAEQSDWGAGAAAARNGDPLDTGASPAWQDGWRSGATPKPPAPPSAPKAP